MTSRSRAFLFVAALSVLLFAACQPKKEKEYQAVISTEYGDITVKLFNSTPLHRDNFIKLAKSGFYDGTLFHRVIQHFVIQGGDPDSRAAVPNVAYGTGGTGYMIDAEIGAPHFRGALAAARTDNPEKKSSGCQFYIVTGTRQTETDLRQYEAVKKIRYNDVQRQRYINEGGVPRLDMEYTVFGEVTSGMDVVDKINNLETQNDRPVHDVKMTIKMVEDK
jgi:cyclophilin family peptidyl-prolyl cis-trans isomerase